MKGFSVSKLILLLLIAVSLDLRAYSLAPASFENLQSAILTLNFLESLPSNGPIVVGVIYTSDIPGSKSIATETANAMSAMRGPNSRILQPIVLSLNDLDRFQGRLDVIFLEPGVSMHPERVLVATGRLHAVSISADPVCMDSRCCVLLVRSGQQVEISLNTSLASAIGARFSMVFMMVVKRR
jgi:hypothetical protein